MHRSAPSRAFIETLESKQLLSATYYVSTAGSDANAGSASRPFASIRQAAIVAKPGDTVLVRGGVYHPTQQIWIGSNGTKKNPIVYKPFKNEKVTLDGSWMPASTDLLSIGGDYVTIQGFTIQNSRQIGVVVLEANGVRITGNHITGSSWQGIAGWGSHANAYTDLVIENNTINDNTRGFFNEAAGNFAQGIAVQKCAKVTVRGNTVYNNWGEGILLSQDGAGSTVEKNTAHDNFGINIYLMDQNGAIVQDNYCYSTGDKRFYRFNAPARAVQVANETWGSPQGGHNNTIVNNLAVGCSYGLYYGNYYVGGGMHDTTIANNTWVNCTDGSIYLDADNHSNVTIKNNIVSQSAAKPYIKLTSGTGLMFASNLWSGKGTLSSLARSKTDISGNPKFVKTGTLKASDYRLQSTSPAINKGASVAISLDMLGTTRKKGKAVDLGAFELM